MYSMARRDYKSLSRYRGLAVCLCHQLGLHQNQKRFTLDTLNGETRKRVFWCQYVLDRCVVISFPPCHEFPAFVLLNPSSAVSQLP
jgi:hypothetical protein